MGELQHGDPARVGPYRIIEVLGSGGMGRVYLGKSAGDRLVAVKVIRADLAADPEFRARFRREVDAARKVNGFYTATVVDADVDAAIPWLATAYVAGPSLERAVASRGPFAPGALRSLTAGLAEGLAAIHAVGLVHRDLKPSNVLLADDGPRVIDFGISRALETSGLTATGLFVGSPGYMSPEQAEGREVGPASDVFNLGAVLCFAATGHGPFGAGPVAALIFRAVTAPPDIGGVPAWLRPLVARCLAKDPAERPTAAAILAELGDWEPAPVPPPAAPAHPPTVLTPPPAPAPVPPAAPAPVPPAAPAPVASAATLRPAPDPAAIMAPFASPTMSVPSPGSSAPPTGLPGTIPGAGQVPPAKRGSRRKTWLAVAVAAAVVVAAAIAVPLSLAKPASPVPTVAAVYSGSQYGFNKPDAFAFDSAHVWVANFGGNSVTEMDANTGAFVRTLSGPAYGFDEPSWIDDDGTHLWVTNYGGNSITELNASDGSFVATINNPSDDLDDPTQVTEDGSHLWVVNQQSPGSTSQTATVAGSVTELNASDGSLITVLSGSGYDFDYPYALTVDGANIWVASAGPRFWNPNANVPPNVVSVEEISAADGSVEIQESGDTSLYDEPIGIVAGDGKIGVINELGNSMAVLDDANGNVLTVLTGGQYGFNAPVDGAVSGQDVWVTNYQGNSVTELSDVDGSWIRTLSGSSYHLDHPTAIAVDGTHLWIANVPNTGGSVTELSIG